MEAHYLIERDESIVPAQGDLQAVPGEQAMLDRLTRRKLLATAGTGLLAAGAPVADARAAIPGPASRSAS